MSSANEFSQISENYDNSQNSGMFSETGSGVLSVFISEQLNRLLVNAAQDLTQRAILKCAEHYNFDGLEAIKLLGLSDITVVKVERKPPSDVKKAKKEVKKHAFPLPYNGEFNDGCCYALRQNNGLYTQCQVERKNGSKDFCKSCQSLADKSETGVPDYGTIQQRNEVGLFEYIDPKGRVPVPYTKVMKKYKITQEQALEEALRFDVIIDETHFVVPDETKRGRPKEEKPPAETKGAKGRPKKTKKVLQIDGDDDDDLFAALVADANSDNGDETQELQETQEIPRMISTPETRETKLKKKKEALRIATEIDKTEKEAKLAADKAEKEAKLAADKAEKEAKLAAAKAEKEAKLAAAKVTKEAKLPTDKAAKATKEAKLPTEKATTEAKLPTEKATKEAKLPTEKATKEAKLAEKADEEFEDSEDSEDEEDEEEGEESEDSEDEDEKETTKAEKNEPDVVKKIDFEGKKYLLSKTTGLIYDYKEYVTNGEQKVLGHWNETKSKIDFSPDSDEESEEEYDEE